MSRAKKPHGHYCRICGQYKANEKFSGRGHAAHICKACAKRGNKPPEITAEPVVYIDIETLSIDVDNLDFIASIDDEPPKKKRKRKPSKEKILRSAQKKQAKVLLSEMLANGDVSKTVIQEAATKAGITNMAERSRGRPSKIAYLHSVAISKRLSRGKSTRISLKNLVSDISCSSV